mgnify:CR=1 FL=1
MAFTFRSKRLGYDNISVGNATGLENAVVAGTGRGETSRLALDSRGNTSTSALAEGAPEHTITDGVSDDVRTGQASSDLNPGSNHTSGTSNTSKFVERLGV